VHGIARITENIFPDGCRSLRFHGAMEISKSIAINPS
jgi:hypothetical protein